MLAVVLRHQLLQLALELLQLRRPKRKRKRRKRRKRKQTLKMRIWALVSLLCTAGSTVDYIHE